DRGKEVHSKHMLPHVERGIDRAQTASTLRLRRYGSVVDQRMQLAPVQSALDVDDRLSGPIVISEIHLNMVLRAHFPWAVFRECMARTGDHAPAGRGETFY